VGFLWVKSENQHKIHPLIVSHGYGASFTSNFLWTGMQDYSSHLTIPFAITLWNEIGNILNTNTNTNTNILNTLRSIVRDKNV
jgi:hypothetical protein